MSKPVLVACEESQAVCIALRNVGIEAYSCDIQECSGGHPEWHIQGDVFDVIESRDWGGMIAFPPCTHLASSGAMHWAKKRSDGRQQQAIDFFLDIAFRRTSHIPYRAVENPQGIMSAIYRKPDQKVFPYYFGDPFSKKTLLWLYGLPKLYHNRQPNLFDEKVTHTERGEFIEVINKKTGKRRTMPKWYADAFLQGGVSNAGKLRSKTFPGIAQAMADQWKSFFI